MEYRVGIRQVFVSTLIVDLPEGATREQIISAASKEIKAGAEPAAPECEYTLGHDDWIVTDDDGDEVW